MELVASVAVVIASALAMIPLERWIHGTPSSGAAHWAGAVFPVVCSSLAGALTGAWFGLGYVGVILAAMCGVGALGFHTYRYRTVRMFRVLAARLGDPDARAVAAQRLRAELDALREQPGEPYEEYAVCAAAAFYDAGMLDDVEELLGPMRTDRLDEVHRAARACWLAACHIANGDAAGAREAIASTARPISYPSWEEALCAMEALVDVLEGRPHDALARAAHGEHGELSLWWKTVRAHALAASGDTEGARALLKQMMAEGVIVDEIASGALPASLIARAALRGDAHPFR
jgi:pentatricopeptide repeat protein